MEEFKVLSLFDGMSCGQIAINKLGIKNYKYFASEIDKAAIKVTQDNYPNTIQLGDVTKVNFNNFYNVDLLIGGSPCQNFSLAGKQKGMITKNDINITTLDQYLELKNNGFEFDGESYLFWEFVNAKNIINPKYWLLENVANMGKYNEDIINRALNIEAIKINSKLVSCQNRPRMYWTNIPNIELPKDKKIYFNDICQNLDEYLDGDINLKIIGRGLNKFSNSNRTRVFDLSLPGKRKIQAIMKTQSKKATDALAIKYKDGYRYPTRIECEMFQTVPIGYTKAATYNESVGMLGNGWTVDVIVHILSHMKN